MAKCVADTERKIEMAKKGQTMNLNFVARQIICVALLAVAIPLMADTETIGSYTWRYQINGDTAEIYNR